MAMHPEDYLKSSPIKIVLVPSWKRENEFTVVLRKKKCPQDNGTTKGFKHLISMTFSGFDKVAIRLQYTGAEPFQNFEDMFAGNPLATWRAMMRNSPPNGCTLSLSLRAL